MSKLNFRLGVADAEISVARGAQEISIGPDGCLGTFPPGINLTLIVRVPKRYHLESFCAHRDRDNDQTPNYEMLEAYVGEDTVKYLWGTATTGKPPKGFTQWPGNQIYVVAKLGKGRFQIWQISIAAQDFRLYLRKQLLYEGKVVSRNGRPVISDPYFLPWRGLDEVIIGRFKYQVLDPEPEYKPSGWSWVDDMGIITGENHIPHFVSTDLREDHGRIDYFTESKGTGGAIVRKDGKLIMARVHYSALHAKDGCFRTIKAGQVFSFGWIQKAKDESWEVKAVTPL